MNIKKTKKYKIKILKMKNYNQVWLYNDDRSILHDLVFIGCISKKTGDKLSWDIKK